MSSQPSLKSYLFMFTAIIGWGFSVPFITLGLDYLTPLSFLTYRFIIATLILTPIILMYRWQQFKKLFLYKWTWIIGLSETTGLVLQYLGQQQGVADGLAALLSLCFLLIVPFLSPFILDERLESYHIIAIIIGFVGVILLFTNGQLDLLINASGSIVGEILLLGAAFGYALYIVSTSRLTTKERPETDSLTLFYSILLIISLSSFASTLVFEGLYPITSLPLIAWVWLGLLVLFSTLIAFFFYFSAMKEITANTASVLLLLQVLIPFSFDFLIYQIRYGIYVMIGSAFILIAMIIVVGVPFMRDRRKSIVETPIIIG